MFAALRRAAHVTATFLLVGCCCDAASPQGTDKPHIIFLLPDDLGYNNVPWNPLSLTKGKLPHLQGLFDAGIHMTHSYVQRWCTPTRAAIMTGRFPYRNGWNQYGRDFAEELSSLPLSIELMPAMLKRGGYYAAMFGKWHLGHFSANHTPVGRGFDEYFGFLLGSETHDTHNSWGKHTCSIGVTDLFNGTVPAKGSGHIANLTYSPEMYGSEMAKLIGRHSKTPATEGKPLFLYMAFQNNHAPYTIVPVYETRWPELAQGKSRLVYSSNMAALDDAVGVLRASLAGSGDVFLNRTLVVFTADNGGPAEMANNLPLRGAKFGVFEGGVRSNGFIWGPGVLPERTGRAGGGGSGGGVTVPVFSGIFHVVDWYATFAGIAGVATSATGPVGFASPDGIDQWPAFIAVARGDAAVVYPRDEVVIDLNIEGNSVIVALRSGDHKIIYGSVGVTTVIADTDYGCSDCCPLRRSYPNASSGNMCTAVSVSDAAEVDNRMGALLQNGGPSTACTEAEPCIYNVVADVNESVNLFGDPAYSGVVAQLRARVAYHSARQWRAPIDHTNYTAAQYCGLVKRAGWVQPFGYAPPGLAPTPPPPPPPSPPVPPPGPVPPAIRAALLGAWRQGNNETFAFVADNAAVAEGLQLKTLSCGGCCWSVLNVTGAAGPTRRVGVSTVLVAGHAPKCSQGGHRANTGALSASGNAISWTTTDGHRATWSKWTKVVADG